MAKLKDYHVELITSTPRHVVHFYTFMDKNNIFKEKKLLPPSK